MPRFAAWDIRWIQEPRPVKYRGKRVYCTAYSAEEATQIFEGFAKQNNISVIDMHAGPLTEEPTDGYFRV